MRPNAEQKTRAAQQFIGWVKRFHPEMHAAIVSRAGEAPKAGALNQLGAAWDMFYPSMYYGGTGYGARYHTDAQHLGQFPGEDAAVPTSTQDSGAWYTEIFKFAKEAVPAYMAYDAQKDIMNMNIERAKQGLPPIDPGLTAPQVKVIHQLPPEVQAEVINWKNNAIKIAIWAAVGLAGFFVIRRMV